MLHFIQDYISPTYEQYSKDRISRIDFSNYKLILKLTTNQNQDFKNKTYLYSEYDKKTQNLSDFQPIDEFDNEDIDSYSNIFINNNNNIYVKLHSFEELNELLLLNQDNKYIFIPITISISNTDAGHICLLIFDLSLNIVLFFDPNGNVKYVIIDKLFNKYIMTFNEIYNMKFYFVSQDDWTEKNFILNTEKISLNNGFNNVDAGHCMCITLIIAHLLTLTDKDINTILHELNKLTIQEKIDLFMGYTENTYNMVNLYYINYIESKQKKIKKIKKIK